MNVWLCPPWRQPERGGDALLVSTLLLQLQGIPLPPLAPDAFSHDGQRLAVKSRRGATGVYDLTLLQLMGTTYASPAPATGEA